MRGMALAVIRVMAVSMAVRLDLRPQDVLHAAHVLDGPTAMQPQQLDTQIVEYVLDNLDLRHDVGGPEAAVSVAVRLHDHRQPLRRAVGLAPA